jgi:hypothetical protein
MKPTQSKIDQYQIVVKESRDRSIIEWSGSLTLIHQENGEMHLDITFNDEGIYLNIQDQSLDADTAELSIELMECEILSAVEYNPSDVFLPLSSAMSI